MEVCVKPKKMRQARLKFGQTKKMTENKENVPLIHDEPSTDQENNGNGTDDALFKPIPRKVNKRKLGNNVLEVQVDVHQTIQCPEVSTSSMESDEEKSDDVIDLTEDDLQANQKLKMSDETSRNIDAVIDSVIQRGLVDAESLFVNQSSGKDSRKRCRSKSPCNLTDKTNSSLKAETIDLTETDVSVIKKPRRSILDMLCVSKKDAENTDNEVVQKCAVESNEVLMDVDVNKPTNEENVSSFAKAKPILTLQEVKDKESDMSKSAIAMQEVETIDLCEKEEQTSEEMTTPSKEKPADVQSAEKTKPSTLSAKKSKNSRKSTEAQKLEKEKEREEKRKLKEEEKRAREAEKLEIKRKKEEERLQREEEKRKKKEEADKMREEKLRKKQEEVEKKKAELEAKRIEKEKKDEEKRKEKEQKEAEKRAKEEEKLKVLEEKAKVEEDKKRKSEKQAMSFKNFFTSPAKTPLPKKSLHKVVGSFVPFQLKDDMYLCPQPQSLSSEKKLVLEQQLVKQTATPSYLQGKAFVKRCRPRTIPTVIRRSLSLSEDGVEILSGGDAVNPSKLRAKLLQFSENVRPPYYGTWRRKSKILSYRNPLKQDKDLFDYEMDSDEEWEDPGEGEDIANSDGEEEGEKDKDDDEDDADGFFVPHGYLSDDEGINEEGEEENVTEERSDQKLKMKQQEFENSFKQKIKVLVPLVVGCVWDDDKDKLSSSRLAELQKYEVKFFVPGPIDLDEKLVDDVNKSETKTPSSTKKSVPEEAIPDLIRMLHGNPHSLGRLVPEFQEFWKRKNTKDSEESSTLSVPIDPVHTTPISSYNLYNSPLSASGLSLLNRNPYWISKTQLNKKIKEIGTYAKKENFSRACWLVLDQVFAKYELNQSDFPIPCKWDYLTFEPDVKLTEIPPLPTEVPSNPDTPAKGNIDKFATKVSAKALLEKSNLRILQEKEKQVPQTLQVLKFATNKISPEKLLETSRQNSVDSSKQKRRINLTTIALAADCDNSFNCENDDDAAGPSASFGFPSHDAFKSFFKVKEIAPPKKSMSKEISKNRAETMDCENSQPDKQKILEQMDTSDNAHENDDVVTDSKNDNVKQEEKMEISDE